MTFNDKWKEKFEKGCNADNISDPPTDTEWLKSHITSRQNSLLDEIVEKLKKNKERANSLLTSKHGILSMVTTKPSKTQ